VVLDRERIKRVTTAEAEEIAEGIEAYNEGLVAALKNERALGDKQQAEIADLDEQRRQLVEAYLDIIESEEGNPSQSMPHNAASPMSSGRGILYGALAGLAVVGIYVGLENLLLEPQREKAREKDKAGAVKVAVAEKDTELYELRTEFSRYKTDVAIKVNSANQSADEARQRAKAAEAGKKDLEARVNIANATNATQNQEINDLKKRVEQDEINYDVAENLFRTTLAEVEKEYKTQYNALKVRLEIAVKDILDADETIKYLKDANDRLLNQAGKTPAKVPEVKESVQVQPVQPAPAQPQTQQDDKNQYAWSYVMEHYGKDRKQTGESSLIALTKTGEYVVLDGKTHEIRTDKDNKPLVFANYEAAGNGIQRFVDDAAILPVYPNDDRKVFRSTWYNPLSKNGVPLPTEIANLWEHANNTSFAIGPTLGAITGTLNTFLLEGNLRNTVPTNALKHATENVPVVRKITRGLDKFTQGTAAACIGGTDFNQSGAKAIVGDESQRWYGTGPLGWLTHSYSDADNFAYGNGYQGSATDRFFQGVQDTYELLVKGANLGLIYKAPEMLKKDETKSTPLTSNGGGSVTGGDN